jgi:5-(carboxyamino)imidazole ribonucleotide mutase
MLNIWENLRFIMSEKVEVAVLAGSTSDEEVYNKTIKVLKENNIPHELKILSAHRDPEKLDVYLKKSKVLIFIAIAGLSAALPGVIASKTDKPVIGVPVSAKLGGLDALLSIAQMPPRVPVGCVGIDRGENAAYLAIRILNLIKK